MTQEMLDDVIRQNNQRKIWAMTKTPRVSQRCPVAALKVNGPGDKLGYLIQDEFGHIVEVLSEGASEDVEERFQRRYPWYSTQWARRFGIYNSQVWPTIVNVDNKEFRRLMNLEPWSENAAKIRMAAWRRERWARLRQVLNDLHGNMSVWVNEGDKDPSAYVIYWHADKWLEEQVKRLAKLGAIEHVGPPEDSKSAKVCGYFRRTDLTPAYL